MDEYSSYQTQGINDKPAMNFISKLQPCLKELNAEFLAIKEKIHNAESDDLDNLIHKWNDVANPESIRTKILHLLTEEVDELRFDVKINMYKNHLGGITWIEQVIQRQFYFAKRHFNTQLKDFIKIGFLPLYPERKTDAIHSANRKQLNAMAADFLQLSQKLEDVFASVYPSYIPILLKDNDSDKLVSYPTRITLDYQMNDRVIELLHNTLNIHFILEVELADFKLHFQKDGYLPKLIWLNDDQLLYSLFFGLSYGNDPRHPKKENIKIVGDGFLMIQNHFRKEDKEFTSKHNIQKNYKKDLYYSLDDEDNKKVVALLERINLS